ncbi:MAG TPA: DUF937 domain-containing protein [Micropruina sp.]|nr:DUF937 domain-containing protein [Micropruina sp.]
MSAADDIIADLPLDQLAQQLGTDPATAEAAVRAALPSLFGGLQANAQTGEQSSLSLAEALTQHSDPQFLEGGVNLDDVDTDDGHAIVQHIFANSPEQAQVLQASSAGAGGNLINKVLPILAPIVMAYLAKRLSVGSSSQQRQSSESASGGMGGLGDLLGPILGGLFGGTASAQSGAAGGGLGDILGQIFGDGGQQAPAQQAPAQQAPAEKHDSGQWTQPQFDQGGDSNGPLSMPSVQEDPRDSGSQQQQPQSGGIGDILGGLFGR